MQHTAPIRLLIVEDDPLLRDRLKPLLDGEPLRVGRSRT